MAFPQTILPVVGELFLGNTWVDVSADLLRRDMAVVARGRAREGVAQVEPTSCRFTLKNTTGKYDPRNAGGAYFGQIGRNTPCRIGITRATDAFSRTVTEGWGNADLGGSWTTFAAGGVISATDTSVSSGVGKHSVPAVASYRSTYLDDTNYGDVDIAVTLTLPFTDVTGGDLEPANLMVRGVSTSDYYLARVVITTAEAVTIKLMHSGGTEIASVVTVAGITHSSAQALRVRVQAEAQTMRAKVWVASGNEPYDWTITGAFPATVAKSGFVGIRSGVSSANTNALPIVFSYDNLVVSSPRFSGELSSLQQRWDKSGNDRWVEVEAGSVLRRIGQGTSALRSSLYRGMVVRPNLRAYWPAEDGNNAKQIASGISGDPAMTVSGAPTFEAEDGFDCSGPLPSLDGSIWTGEVPTYSGTGAIQLRWLMFMPAAEAAGSVLARLECTGTAPRWELAYGSTPGRLRLRAYDGAGTQILDTTDVSFASFGGHEGNYMRFSLELNQDGADVDWGFSTLQVGASVGLGFSGTLTGRTVTTAQKVAMNPTGSFSNTVMGHAAVESAVDNMFALYQELEAWVGETAADRIQRLCDEESIDVELIGLAADTVPMGPQRPAVLVVLLQGCATADTGTLFEARGRVALVYRTRTSLYNQSAALTLDYASGHLAAPPLPTDDDANTVNDVTAKRVNGSSYRLTRDTGRLSILPPAEGGVGVYDTTEEFNVEFDNQLPDLASWLRHLGTVDEARYPVLSVNLARPGNSTLIDALLSLGLDDRVVLDNLTADDISVLARGTRETFAQFELGFDLNCAPESPWQVLTIGAAGHKIGSANSSLASGVTSSATSLSVAVPGTLWTTAAGQMPISITIAGEVMSVTAVTSVISDTFGRVVASGWGTADSGQAWTTSGGSAADYSTNGSAALVSQGSLNVARRTTIAVSFADVDIAASVSTDVLAAGGSHFVGVMARYLDTGNNYFALLSFTTSGAITIAILKRVAGAESTVASATTSLTHAAGTRFSLRLQTRGSTLRTRAWLTSAVEPTSWDIDTTDTSLTAAGSVGTYSRLSGANTNTLPVVATWDDVTVRNPQTFTVTRSINGVVKAHSAGAAIRLTRRPTIAL